MNAAHIHLVLNHIPVLGALGTLGLLALAVFKKNDAISKLCLQFMVLIGILTLPVYLTGEPAEEIIEHLPGITESFIKTHEKYALFSLISTEVLAVIGVVGLYLHRKKSLKIMNYWQIIGVVALINASLMAVTANYGGEIRHSEIRKEGLSSPTSENEDH